MKRNLNLKEFLLGSTDEYTVREIDHENIRVLQVMSAAVAILEAVLLIMILLAHSDNLNYKFSIWNSMFAIVSNTVVYFLCRQYLKKEETSHRKAALIVVLSMVAMFLLGIETSAHNYSVGRQMLIFFMIIMCHISYVRVRPILCIIVYPAVFTAMYLVCRRIDGAGSILQINYFIYIVVTVLSGIVAYRSFLRAAEHKKKSEELMLHLSDMTFHDSLTGLLNRHALDVKLNPHEGRTYYVAMSDVNLFKTFNDTYGHQVGDQVLKETAQSLHRHFRKTDCYRYGGDEFLIISENIGREAFMKRIYDWKKDVGRIRIPGVEQGITISYGMMFGPANDKAELFELIRQADNELYKIKKGDPDVMNDAEEIVQDVYEAMIKKQIVPYFQPKVDIRTNKIIGAEALVRWKRGSSLVPPGSFIPILEVTGEICELDMFVFEQVCIQMQDWAERGIPLPTVSSNFSMKHLAHSDFTDEIIEIANKYEVPHEHLEIEMTETVNPEEEDRLRKVIQTLRGAGFRTALDDFGSGYSSLALVKNVPMDTVKLDKSLLTSAEAEVGTSDRGRALITHIVGLVKDMQMMCLCEGVETVKEKEFLRSVGCNYVQGYLYDKPLEATEFESRLLAGPYPDTQLEEEDARQEEEKKQTAERSVTVLLAEDNDINREITTVILEELGASVVPAVDGQDAYEIFKNSAVNTFDLILMDIQMPIMDGYQSTRAIRALTTRLDATSVPIIAITVDSYKETRAQAEEAGMSGYVTKPLDPSRLVTILEGLKK